MIQLISEKNMKLSSLVKHLNKYFASGEINSEVEDKEGKMKELASKYKGKISWLDGVRIDFDDWWFNVRASNTENTVRLNLEGMNEDIVKEKVEEVSQIIKE